MLTTGATETRLPTELLIEIFLLTQEHDHSLAEPEQVEGNSKVAMGISHVCRRWRATALGIPNLWTYSFYQTRKARHKARFMRIQIKRSQWAPLIFYLRLREHPEDDRVRKLVEVCIGRVQKIYIEEDCPKLALAILNRARAPRLRTLALYGPAANYHLNPSCPFPNGFGSLETFHLHRMKIDLSTIPTAVQGLTSLTLDKIPYSCMAAILKSVARDLTSLTLGKIDATRQDTASVILPSLHELTFNTCPTSAPRWIIPHHLKVVGLCDINPLMLMKLDKKVGRSWAIHPLEEVEELVIRATPRDYLPDGAYWVDRHLRNLPKAFPNVSRINMTGHCLSPRAAQFWCAVLGENEHGVGMFKSRWPMLKTISVSREDVRAALLEEFKGAREDVSDMVVIA
ncbi:hypothetical protein CYLTODRAFT_489986 [Cylindrobasidium torrendii FP15055 ss-10]|uniref:Uncharacterized protein n=1 Tax=Cylindrobasidium torrendii FP15055 ss-10 TaxID=1314674 RepID=A0A0D7BCC2_9AGAR|nr:hypothetical protein CYLTODRAFT_489986 [Cylindrobasidium torrendii FP15055 ss-10]